MHCLRVAAALLLNHCTTTLNSRRLRSHKCTICSSMQSSRCGQNGWLTIHRKRSQRCVSRPADLSLCRSRAMVV
ncbi:hypothetical protein F5Y19DRAFT_410230 [Xylariaceae sp. FL1651]|nr:hypothetical protein F5Y19DRAFT_410230 [Xylariaceae sp. FL1651]